MTMDIAILLYFIAQFADVATTVWGLDRGHTEANPWMDRLMGIFGWRWFIVKIVLAGGAAYTMEGTGHPNGLMIVTAIVAGVALRNFVIVRKG